jgi:mannose-6-phosphate isomerase-like protein (cupin superfamily)
LDAGVSYCVVHASEHTWEERPAVGSDAVRLTADVTTSADLTQSRARVWQLPPHARGRRHKEGAQEEVFVVLEGTLTVLLGDPPERVDVTKHSVVAVQPGTAIQLRNESDAPVTLFAYGAPPVTGGGEFLDDVEEI